MVLDFISDIASVGDMIRLKCDTEIIYGEIMKISPKLVAVKMSSGALVIKKDEEISDIVLNPDTSDDAVSVSNEREKREDLLPTPKKLPTEDPLRHNLEHHQRTVDANVSVTANKEPDIALSSNVTVGNYEDAWNSLDYHKLKKFAKEIQSSLSKKERTTIVSSNASVREVLKRSFRVNTEHHPKLSVSLSTIIEKSLYEELMRFNIGDSLPMVIYFHEQSSFKTVFLTLSPNTLGGYSELLCSAIEEKHYRQAKSLCYFLVSQLNRTIARKNVFILLKELKPINAFIKESIKSESGAVKIPDNYKILEKELNQLVKEGNNELAIKKIESALKSNVIDEKYRSSLLLRRAQAFSSLTDYENAKHSYKELIAFKEQTNGDPKNLSHLYTELARLQAMSKGDLGDAKYSAEKALRYNPGNKYASTLLEQIRSGYLTSVSVSSSLTEEDADEDKEMMIDSDDSKFVISKMIEFDIKEHKYSNDLIIANGGIPTTAIADTIFQEAKQSKGADLGERFPIYLEAAKAYSELPPGSYDLSHYTESLAFYAVYKGNFIFTKFSNAINTNSYSDILSLKRMRDSACSYYIESLNLLSSTNKVLLSMILCNYIKLHVATINIQNKREVDLSGNFNKIVRLCINNEDKSINDIFWKTIVEVGTASLKAWNQLWTERTKWRREFYLTLKDDNKRPTIYVTINDILHTQIDITFTPGRFFKKALSYRQTQITDFTNKQSRILKEDIQVNLLSPILDIWKEISESVESFFNETERESKDVIDNILLILKPYPNRNQVERTNILIQTQRKIDEHLKFINENTTYYGRTFFFPLLSIWRRVIANLLEKKIAETLPQLTVVADPPYMVQKDEGTFVNLIIKNLGESTAEGCVMIPEITDIASGVSKKARNEYKNEIPAGSNMDISMNLPPIMKDSLSIKLSMSISAIYQGKEQQNTIFDFTLEREPLSSLEYTDIPWTDGQIPAEQMFKGRKPILDILIKHYTSIEKDKPYILYGLTRTGKSSILKYLAEALNKKEVHIEGKTFLIATFSWDLSQAANFGNAHDMWEYLLYDQFNEYLDAYIGYEGYHELGMSDKPRAKDLNNALQFLHKKLIYPIFMVDEFSYIKVLMDNGTITPAFLHTLRQLSMQGLASFIYAGTYDIKALLKDSKYGITGQLVNAVEEQIAEIDRQSAEELINVMGNKLIFTPDAIAHIHELSGDVPYFVQMICKYCGFYAVENKRSIIGYPELEHIIKILTGESQYITSSLVKTLPENVFQNNMFSPADSSEVNVLISSIAHFNRNNKENPRGVGIIELQELWATKNIAAFRPKLAESIELLCQKKVLVQEEDEGLPVYRFTVDLFRRWWTVHNPDINLQLDKIL